MNTSNVTYTELETKVINALRGLIADGYELIYIGDLEYCGLDLKEARGAMGSLVKKRVIDVNKEDGGIISLLID